MSAEYPAWVMARADQEIAQCDAIIDGVLGILAEMRREGRSDLAILTTAMASLMRVLIKNGHPEMINTFFVPLMARMYVRLMKAGESAGTTQV